VDLEKLKNKKKKLKNLIHEEKDLYSVLGFESPYETNTDDIRSAYKKLALQYHPDK
jgi:preprotein translocase subunit Sec63